MKKLIITLIVLSLCTLVCYFFFTWRSNRLYRNPALAGGNGRIEATEINVAAKHQGKVEKVLVQEGDSVKAGQVLVKMETNVQEASLAQAKAKLQQAVAEEERARATIGVQEAQLSAKKSQADQARVITENAETRLRRAKVMVARDATSKQEYDNAEALWLSNKASLASALASVKQAEADVLAAKANAASAKANILAAKAQIQVIQEEINDSYLKAPLMGRIQYRVAEPGEGLASGGRAINMVDLTDVYMTFYLSEELAGKVRIGADVRIVLDAAPTLPIPAKVAYVASVAQFTPKTVETKVERQKLMFRVKAYIAPELLLRVQSLVKTGIPGVAWVKLDPKAPWPKELLSYKERTGRYLVDDMPADAGAKK